MKKAVLKILLTFAILSAICCAFWQLRWLTSANEAAILFAITGGVIAIDRKRSITTRISKVE